MKITGKYLGYEYIGKSKKRTYVYVMDGYGEKITLLNGGLGFNHYRYEKGCIFTFSAYFSKKENMYVISSVCMPEKEKSINAFVNICIPIKISGNSYKDCGHDKKGRLCRFNDDCFCILFRDDTSEGRCKKCIEIFGYGDK